MDVGVRSALLQTSRQEKAVVYLTGEAAEDAACEIEKKNDLRLMEAVSAIPSGRFPRDHSSV